MKGIKEINGQEYPICKIVTDSVIIYGKEWLYKNLETEFERLKVGRELMKVIKESEDQK